MFQLTLTVIYLIGIIFERIPQELKVIISRSFKNNVWNLENLLEVFKPELMVRETCFAVSSSGTRIKKRIVFLHQKHFKQLLTTENTKKL